MVRTTEDALAKERAKTTTTTTTTATKKTEDYRTLNDQVYLIILFYLLKKEY
jgi:hypothetical protein